jgi:hypothetical protein
MKSRFLLTRVGDSCFFQALDRRVLANKDNKKLMLGMPDFAFSVEASPMATNDPIPLFLSDLTEDPEQAGILKAWDTAVIASRILKIGILIVAAAAIVFAVLSMGNPSVLFANATAFLVGTSAPQDGTGQSIPTIQPTADAQALPPTASEAPTGEEIAAVFKTTSHSETEIREPPAEALLRQYQAWAAEEDARTQVRPLRSEQDAQAQPVQDAQAQVRPVQKQVRPARNARAKVVKNARAQVRREQHTQAQVQPAQRHSR